MATKRGRGRPKVLPYETRDNLYKRKHGLTAVSVDRETHRIISAVAKAVGLTYRQATRGIVLGQLSASDYVDLSQSPDQEAA